MSQTYTSLAHHYRYISAYIDTLELFMRWVPKRFRKNIQQFDKNRILIKPCETDSGNIWGFRICVNQPSTKLLLHFADLQKKHDFLVHRCDIAIDFITDNPTNAVLVADCLRRHIMLRWRRKGPMVQIGETTYWTNGRSNRNLALYADRPSRTEGGYLSCAHLELRFMNSGAVRRAGLQSIQALINLPVKKVLSHNLVLLDFNVNEFINRTVRRSLAAERKSFVGRQGRRSHPFVDHFRASMRHRIVCLIARVGLDTAQGFKDAYPAKGKRLRRVPVINQHHVVISRKSPLSSMRVVDVVPLMTDMA